MSAADRPDSPTQRITPSVADLDRRFTALERNVATLLELLVKAYENTPQATTAVLNARRNITYGDAYSDTPLVTVRIGTYRGGDLLFDRALCSVCRQTYPNWEAIVVCDGHEPHTAARIESLGDPRIRCLQRPRNGPYPDIEPARWYVAGTHPFNEAVAHARGAWIAPIDDDDEWTDDHLEVLVATAQRARAELVYGVARVLVDEGETFFGMWPPSEGDFGFQAAIYHAGLAGFLYDINAHLIGEVADWHLARRMLDAGVRFDFVERVVTTYYVGAKATGIDWWRERVRQRGRFHESQPCGRPATVRDDAGRRP
ncbi:MAG TPA: glycosyltransferase [Solirubrobacteraceae bacterium]|nr:glycosyltransferase [Solirubrobacteraceae bacterium]